MRALRTVTGVAAALTVAASAWGCGGGRPPASDAPPPAPDSAPPVRPLAGMATQPVALLPAQYVRGGDSTGWAARIGSPREFLASVDAEIGAQLAARGAARTWMLPDALARMARRNPGITADPYALSAEGLRAGVRRTDPSLGEPLASQIRGLIALTEARFALVPVEVRFEPVAGGGRAALRLALVDGRLSQVRWTGDVFTDPAAQPSAAGIAAALGEKVADLIAPR